MPKKEVAELNTTADYIRAYKNKAVLSSLPNNVKKLRVALLASSTINGLKEVLSIKSRDFGIDADVYVGEYNQYTREILDDKSELYTHKSDVIFLFIDTRAIKDSFFLNKKEDSWVNEKFAEIKSLIEKLEEKTSATIIIHNFERLTNSPLGILANKEKNSFTEMVGELNRKLVKETMDNRRVFIFDYDNFLAKVGKEKAFDPKFYYLADIKLNLELLPELAEAYIKYLIPIAGLTKKCLVLDLDGILWGGIIGEDGLSGIKLGPTPEGRPFWELQQYILALREQGVILAINSKNNLADVQSVFKKHPYCLLKDEHFAALEINWNDKIANMKKLAADLNIGLDSFVFLDDDKTNRMIVREALPEVLTLEMPDDPALYLRTLSNLPFFNKLKITEEDRKRGDQYREEKKRTEFKSVATNMDEYLKGLDIKVEIKKADKFTIPRIAQLISKTNQFNTTTKRYSETEVAKMANSKDYLIISIKAEDRFGDSGITGVAIIKMGSINWHIDSYLLSCRILGKEIETTFLWYILEEAKKVKVTDVTADFIKTAKNVVSAPFFKKSGFELLNSSDVKETWKFDLKKKFTKPAFIKIVKA